MVETYRETIVGIASELVGRPSRKYVTGHPELGQSPDTGFDCSGMVSFVLREAGLYVPDFIGMDGERRSIRHASEFWDHYGIAVHSDLVSPGDLLFMSRTGQVPTHIGIVRDEETYIHAPGRDETHVEIAPIVSAGIATKGLARKLYSRNPIGFKSPTERRANPTYRYHQQPLSA
jgi:cell wall-associated NlpC family hydrolase